MTTPRSLQLVHVRAMRYRMPLKRAYGTARGVTTAGDNFLIQVTASHGNSVVEGIGECQPRHALTGDGGKDRSAAWAYACHATDQLHGRPLSVADAEDAVAAIRAIMADLDGVAREHADENNRDRPFRGTQLGLEVALLDVAARALGLQIAELLGKRRDRVEVSISTISSSTNIDEVAAKVIRQQRYPMTRVKGVGDPAHDLGLLDVVTEANRSVGREKAVWIDINEAMDVDGASELLCALAARMAAGTLPASMIVEGLLPKAQVTRLPELQRLADDECRRTAKDRVLDLRIMPDEGLWDAGDVIALNSLGGCRAINIKAPKAGGLLASLDLANAAVEADPDIHISIGGMIGTSDITAWALHNLARALPRLDYLTAVPPQNVHTRIAEPLARYVERGSNVISPQESPGLGTRLRAARVAPFVVASHDPSGRTDRRPAEAARTTGPALAVASGPGLARHLGLDLGANDLLASLRPGWLDSYLLERAALAYGLHCVRFSPNAFTAGPSADVTPTLGFHLATSLTTSKAGRLVADNRLSSGAALRYHHLPTPDSRTFGPGSVSRAVRYANRIGYPVVAKPVNRQHGQVVSAVSDEQQLRRVVARLSRNTDDQRQVVIQPQVPGVPYRVLVVDGRGVAVLRRSDGRDVTGETHPELLELARRATAAVPGIVHAGVDLMADRHDSPPRDGSVVILDVDANPRLGAHELPVDGQSRPVADALVGAGGNLPGSPAFVARSVTATVSLMSSGPPAPPDDHIREVARTLGLSTSVRAGQERLDVTVEGRVEHVALVPLLIATGTFAPELIETTVTGVAAGTGREEW